MLKKIQEAVTLILHILRVINHFDEKTTVEFKRELSRLLEERLHGHWYPDQPRKGQAYRCLRINRRVRMEKTLQEAAKACGLKYRDLNLPLEFTVWIDPDEVAYRFGESIGSLGTFASFQRSVTYPIRE